MCQLLCPKFVVLEKGIPNQLPITNNKISRVPVTEIPTSEAAIKHFEDIVGGRLTRVEVYGKDPLEGHPYLKVLRKQRYYKVFTSDKDIFNAIMQKQSKVFEDALCYFQNLSVTLSQGL